MPSSFRMLVNVPISGVTTEVYAVKTRMQATRVRPTPMAVSQVSLEKGKDKLPGAWNQRADWQAGEIDKT